MQSQVGLCFGSPSLHRNASFYPQRVVTAIQQRRVSTVRWARTIDVMPKETLRRRFGVPLFILPMRRGLYAPPIVALSSHVLDLLRTLTLSSAESAFRCCFLGPASCSHFFSSRQRPRLLPSGAVESHDIFPRTVYWRVPLEREGDVITKNARDHS
jgi:hypothetical protein